MTAGCLLFVPASYTGVRGIPQRTFVLASGITIVQAVANPLIGPPATAHSRLTFAGLQFRYHHFP
jgi:fucose permease